MGKDRRRVLLQLGSTQSRRVQCTHLAATNTVVGRCTERISRLAVPSLSATAWTQVLSGNNTKACAPASGAPSRRTVMTPAPLPEDGSATVFVPQTPELLAARERAASPDCSCLLGLTVGASFPRDWIFDRRPWPHLAHGRTMAPTHRLTAGSLRPQPPRRRRLRLTSRAQGVLASPERYSGCADPLRLLELG